MSAGQGFQFVGGAIVPLGTSLPGSASDVAPKNDGQQSARAEMQEAARFNEEIAARRAAGASHAAPKARGKLAPPALSPGDVGSLKPRKLLQLARARVRWLKQELRRARQLDLELAELERLIAAASPPRPLASVQKISAG